LRRSSPRLPLWDSQWLMFTPREISKAAELVLGKTAKTDASNRP
jgi:hypothetical protein